MFIKLYVTKKNVQLRFKITNLIAIIIISSTNIDLLGGTMKDSLSLYWVALPWRVVWW